MKPNWREMNVLKELCLGSVEPTANFRDAGTKTIAEMVAKDWIVNATCETYGIVGYRITDTGSEAFATHQK